MKNPGTEEILSGTPVSLGGMIAVAITDIQPGDVGDGFAEGVFLLPKLPADAVTAGEKVYLKAGNVQLDDTDAVLAGLPGRMLRQALPSWKSKSMANAFDNMAGRMDELTAKGWAER